MNHLSVSTAEDGIVAAQECPVCCRPVASSLFRTHVNICVDRSGDCDVGVLVPSPAYAHTHSGITAAANPQTGAVGLLFSSAGPSSGVSSFDGTQRRSLSSSSGGGVGASASQRVGTHHVVGSNVPFSAEGSPMEDPAAGHHQQQQPLQFLRPPTATYQPNNSQYYRHYNDNYYTPADALHRSASAAADQQQQQQSHSNELSGAPAAVGSTEAALTSARYEVGVVVFDDEANASANPQQQQQHRPPRLELQQQLPLLTADTVCADKVAQLMALFNQTDFADMERRASITAAGGGGGAGGGSNSHNNPAPSSQGSSLSPASVSASSSFAGTGTCRSASPTPFGAVVPPSSSSLSPASSLANKERLIREALAAANGDVNVAAIVLLEAGSGWAAPPRDFAYDAADTIETPRGSIGGGGGGGPAGAGWGCDDDNGGGGGGLAHHRRTSSFNGGRVGAMGMGTGGAGHHRVVYASRPPSRSSSAGGVVSPTVGAATTTATVVTSSRHNTVTTALDDEITAAVIGAPLSAVVSAAHHNNNNNNYHNSFPTSPPHSSSALPQQFFHTSGGLVMGPRRPSTSASSVLSAPHSARHPPTNSAISPHPLNAEASGDGVIAGRPATATVVGTNSSSTRAHMPAARRAVSPSPSPSKHSTANVANTSHGHGGGGGRLPRVSSKVELVIYDLKPDMGVAKRLGFGAYHSGVVVYGSEIAYGGSTNLARDSGRSGIWAAKPGAAAGGLKVHERIMVGETHWTAAEIRAMIKQWGTREYIVDNYHLLSCNCNHFSAAFLQRLGERGRLTPHSHIFVQQFGPNGYTTAVAAAQAKHLKRLAKQQKKEREREKGGRGGGGIAPDDDTASLSVRSTAASTASSSSFAFHPTPQQGTTNMVGAPSTTASSSASPPSSLFFPLLTPEQQQFADEVCADASLIRAAFTVPSYVNRAASLGNKVVPDFIFKAFMQKVTAPPTQGGSGGGGGASPTSASNGNTAAGVPTATGGGGSRGSTKEKQKDRSGKGASSKCSGGGGSSDVYGGGYASVVGNANTHVVGQQQQQYGLPPATASVGLGGVTAAGAGPASTNTTASGEGGASERGVSDLISRTTSSLAAHSPPSAGAQSRGLARREYEAVCFIAAALGLPLSPAAAAMGAAIDGSPSRADLVLPLPPGLLSADSVFAQCLRALRFHGGDTSAALEELVSGA